MRIQLSQRVLTAADELAGPYRRLLCRTAAVQQGPCGPGLIRSLQGLLVARLGVPWVASRGRWVAKAKDQPASFESGRVWMFLLYTVTIPQRPYWKQLLVLYQLWSTMVNYGLSTNVDCYNHNVVANCCQQMWAAKVDHHCDYQHQLDYIKKHY